MSEATTQSPRRKPFQFRIAELLIVTAVVGVGATLLRIVQQAQRESACVMNHRQIGIGLHNYYDTWRRFPPPRTDDASGKPMHSWRVLLSPFVESSSFYDRYDSSEPWNGPDNSKLSLERPSGLFRSPSDRASPRGMTNYVAVTGPGTMFPDGKPLGFGEVTDGTSNTIMLVEISHSDIHWMEPRDLPIEELEAWLDPDHQPQLLGAHRQGGLVLFADGHVKMLPRDTPIAKLRAMLSPAGSDWDVAGQYMPTPPAEE